MGNGKNVLKKIPSSRKKEIDAMCENLQIVASLLLWPIGGVMMPWSGSVLIYQKILKLLKDLTSCGFDESPMPINTVSA